MIITVEILKEIAPGGKETGFKLLPELANWMNHYFPFYGIDQKWEYCHFLAQAAHETNSFNTLEEYASGKAYEGRKDLGNIYPGDGVKFKGKGIFQITGRNNYRSLTVEWKKENEDSAIDFEEMPVILKQPQYAVWSACKYWDERDFNQYAVMSDHDQTIWSKKLARDLTPLEYITWRINGGFNGLDQRKSFYERCQKIFV
jgi:putative chitinase